LTVFDSRKKETYYYITSGKPGLFGSGRGYLEGAVRKGAASRRRIPNYKYLPPVFFVSVASKGLSVSLSRLESTLAGIRVGVDSKGS
jgi:hypothetical protein